MALANTFLALANTFLEVANTFLTERTNIVYLNAKHVSPYSKNNTCNVFINVTWGGGL